MRCGIILVENAKPRLKSPQGTASLLGTALDAAWLRNRILLLIEIDTEVKEQFADGPRLLVIYVAQSPVPVVDVEDQALR